jgi:taurine dioxygenase
MTALKLKESFNPVFQIAALSSTLGATVSGLDLSERPDEDTIAALRRALLRYEVLFFENQSLAPMQLRDFAARFGKLHVHPIRPHVQGVPEVTLLQNQWAVDDSGNWRADVTFIDTPPAACLLYAQATPPGGGDTIWASTRAAYDAFSPAIQNFLKPLIASHDFGRVYSEERFPGATRDHPPTTHPVVRTHPETGFDSLFVNPAFTTQILGVNRGEGRKLLEMIFEQIQQPQFLVRHRWKPGTLAFWDNRVTQHYTVADYPANERVMYRVTILGDKPFHRSR